MNKEPFDKNFVENLDRPDYHDVPEQFSFSFTEDVDGKTEEFTYNVSVSVDYDYDFMEYRGHFTDKWEEGCIQLHDCNDWIRSQYYAPVYTIAEVRKDLHKLGYSKGVADYEARKQVYRDMRIAKDPEAMDMCAIYIDVIVIWKCVHIGFACIGGVELEGNEREYLDSLIIDELHDARYHAMNKALELRA
jgi:hypothetical protein